ncbi:MAG: flagellar M-ring protein FliF [Clostridia bacterium]|nr:flagellar M-ring protein FliF [Clostridia bacterium]
MEALKNFWNKVKEKWEALSKENKRLVIILSSVALIVIVTSCFFIFKTNYVQLFADEVDGETMNAVCEVLDSNSFKYKLNMTGDNILVDEKIKSKAKIAIAGSELPSSKFTWQDAIDQNTLGLTDTEKKNIYKLAAEDTLASDLESIDGVKSAKVTLTLPNDDVFAIKSTKASQAAVVLNLTKTLTQQQIEGVAKHVKLSVEGLLEDNISIIDSNANVLYPFADSVGTGLVSTYDQIRENRKEAVVKGVKELLDPLYDSVMVTVNLQMNFDKYQETYEEVTSPLGEDAKVGLITEQHTANEEGSSTSTGGEPGYGSNDEDVSYQLQDAGSNSSSSSNATDTIYAVNKRLSQTEKEVGTVDLNTSSLSIIVYQTKEYDYVTLNKQKKFKDISWKEYKDQVKAESNQLEIPEALIESIQTATGIEDVTINGYVKPKFIDPSTEGATVWLNMIPLVILLGIIGFVAFILVKKTSEVKVVETEPELSVENLLYSTQEKENDLPEITEHVSDSFKRISEFVDEKPDLVAQLLRNWINEE